MIGDYYSGYLRTYIELSMASKVILFTCINFCKSIAYNLHSLHADRRAEAPPTFVNSTVKRLQEAPQRTDLFRKEQRCIAPGLVICPCKLVQCLNRTHDCLPWMQGNPTECGRLSG